MRKISQSQINIFENCQKCYYLRNIAEMSWPSCDLDQSARLRGKDFHSLVQQHVLGITDDVLLDSIEDESVHNWFSNFCKYQPLSSFDIVYPEFTVFTYFSDVLFTGNFDALACKDDKITIFDWKTTKKSGEKSDFEFTPQTRLYRFLAKTNSSKILGIRDDVQPENIQMVYWFPEHPENPVVLPYSETLYQQDISWLKLKAAEMSIENPSFYSAQNNTKTCLKCIYSSFCHPELPNAEHSAAEFGLSD